MKAIGIDTFAMSNPALTSVLLWQFAKSYTKNGDSGPSLSLCFIVLPIVMSAPDDEEFRRHECSDGLLDMANEAP